MEGLLVKINKMRDDARDAVKQKKEDSLLNQIIKLSLFQESRKFLESGSAPRDKASSACVLCKHPRVDEPSIDADLLEPNIERLKERNL